MRRDAAYVAKISHVASVQPPTNFRPAALASTALSTIGYGGTAVGVAASAAQYSVLHEREKEGIGRNELKRLGNEAAFDAVLNILPSVVTGVAKASARQRSINGSKSRFGGIGYVEEPDPRAGRFYSEMRKTEHYDDVDAISQTLV